MLRISITANKCSGRRKAFSTTEVLVAVTLLTAVVVSVGKYASFVKQSIRQRQLAQLLHWELLNTREIIASWQPEEITAERIQSLPISPQLTEQLTQASWYATLGPETAVAALQPDIKFVALQLRANFGGQAIQPLQLKFWVAGSGAASGKQTPASPEPPQASAQPQLEGTNGRQERDD